MSADNPLPLKGEASRQAHDSISGVCYQLWHTVLAWTTLRGNDCLYVEGAEDYDQVTDDAAVATQVKGSAGKITLRSTAVRETIQNFWITQSKNPGRTIYYRFVTKAIITVEKSEPFGPGVAGLELWKQASRDVATSDKLRRFLFNDLNYTDDLRKHLESLTGKQFQENFVRGISWDTANIDTADIKVAVSEYLIQFGNDKNVSPPEAAKVSSRLFLEASDAASNKQAKPLTYAQFLRLFHEETTSSLTPNEIAFIRATSSIAGSLATASVLHGVPTVHLDLTRPPLPLVYAERTATLQEISKTLNQFGLVFLTGSSGMGKSVLALLVASQSTEVTMHVKCRGASPSEVRLYLSSLTQQLQDSNGTLLILDDLEITPGAVSVYQTQLISLVYLLISKGGKIVVTTQNIPTPDLLRRLNIPETVVTYVPRMLKSEIVDFALQLGAPSGEAAELWANLILVQTDGHPQLVHARLLTALRNEWDQPSAADYVLRPEDVLKEQSQARSLLSQVQEEERTLLYRLSLTHGRFRRDHAIAIADIEPMIPDPGDCLDKLVGPWIEKLGNRYFYISPLLSNCAEDVMSPGKVKVLREHVGFSILNCKPLSQFEVSTILLNGLQSESTKLLAPICASLVTNDNLDEIRCSGVLSWLPNLAVDGSNMVYPNDGFVNYLLRVLQFKLAALSDVDQARRVFNKLDQEVTRDNLSIGFAHARVGMAVTCLISYQVDLPAATLIRLIAEVNQFSKEMLVNEALIKLPVENKPIEVQDMMFWFVLARCNSSDFLYTLLTALEENDSDILQLLQEFCIQQPFAAKMFVDRAWLGDSKHGSIDWRSTLPIYKQLIRCGYAWGINEFVEAGIRSTGIILDEYLNEQAEALEFVESSEANFPSRSKWVADEKATILQNMDRHQEALSVWDDVLLDWHEGAGSIDQTVLFAHRKAAISASKIKRWDLAAAHLLAGSEKARGMINEIPEAIIMVLALLADAAYANWKARNTSLAISMLQQVLNEIPNVPSSNEDLYSFKLHKTVSQTVLSIKSEATGKDLQRGYVLGAGFCSNPETPELLKSLPPTPLELIWINLMQLECVEQFPPDIYSRKIDELHRSKIPAVVVYAALVDVERALVNSDYLNLPLIAQEASRLFRALKLIENQDILATEPNPHWISIAPSEEDFHSVILALNSALFTAAVRKEDLQMLLSKWESTAASTQFAFKFRSWIAESQKTVSLSPKDACGCLVSSTSDFYKKVTAVVSLMQYDQIDIDELYFVHVNVLLTFCQMEDYAFVSRLIVEKICADWNLMCCIRIPFGRFSTLIPDVLQLIHSNERGLSKAANLLISLKPAVAVSLSASVERTLQQLALNAYGLEPRGRK